jgi:hypothetical protein
MDTALTAPVVLSVAYRTLPALDEEKAREVSQTAMMYLAPRSESFNQYLKWKRAATIRRGGSRLSQWMIATLQSPAPKRPRSHLLRNSRYSPSAVSHRLFRFVFSAKLQAWRSGYHFECHGPALSFSVYVWVSCKVLPRLWCIFGRHNLALLRMKVRVLMFTG